MKRIVIGCLLAGLLFAAWSIPALGGSASPSNKRLERRIDALAAKLTRTSASVRQATGDLTELKSQVASLTLKSPRSLHTQVVAGTMTLIAPGVVPQWYSGRASCPPNTQLTGGGINFDNAVYGNQPIVERSGPSGNGWVASIRYQGQGNVVPTLGVFAVCADVS